VAQNGKHPFLKGVFSVIFCVVAQNAANGRGGIHNNNITKWQASFNDRLLKMSLCPCLDWIAPKSPDQVDRARSLEPRHWSRWTKRPVHQLHHVRLVVPNRNSFTEQKAMKQV